MLLNDKLELEQDSGQRDISQCCHKIPAQETERESNLIVDETTELLKRELCFVETRRATLLVFNSYSIPKRVLDMHWIAKYIL